MNAFAHRNQDLVRPRKAPTDHSGLRRITRYSASESGGVAAARGLLGQIEAGQSSRIAIATVSSRLALKPAFQISPAQCTSRRTPSGSVRAAAATNKR